MRKGILGGLLAMAAIVSAPIGADGVEPVGRDAPKHAPSRAPYHLGKGVPPMAYTGGRGPIKRNKAKRWHCKRLAKKVR